MKEEIDVQPGWGVMGHLTLILAQILQSHNLEFGIALFSNSDNK